MARHPSPRPLAGAYTGAGALSGYADDPAIGVPPLAGWSLWDEFLKPPRTIGGITYCGDCDWRMYTVGSTPVAAASAPTANHMAGVLELGTNAAPTAGEGGAIGHGYSAINGMFPAGMTLCMKVWMGRKVYTRGFSGLLQVPTRDPLTGPGNNDAIGVGADTAGSGTTWQFVARKASTVTTVDSGVQLDKYLTALLVHQLDGTVNCYTVSASRSDLAATLTLAGTFASSELPTGNTLQVQPLTIRTLDTSQCFAYIDFFGIGGRSARTT